MEPIRLLLIEDDEDDYLITRDLLADVKKQRYQLDWVDNPEDAREALSRNEHDVCLLDYELGAEDGVSLLKGAVELGFTGPIIMLTGQDDVHLDEKAQRAGATDYLVKAYLNAPWLTRAIRYAVSRQEMELERIDRLKAEAENRSKSEFLARLSHELRTPMTAILGYTDLMAGQTNDKSLIQHLQTVKRNGNHLLSLLNDVLDLSKIEAGKLEIEKHTFELRPFLQDIFELMKVYARDKGIELNLSLDSELPSRIYTDPVRLRQILLNLINNAIKFTPEGQVVINVVYQKNEHSVVFSIQDTGIGIRETALNQLFKPFSQISGSSNSGAMGTGLGLSISKQLVNLLGGKIKVKSKFGEGSVFSVMLMLERVNESEVDDVIDVSGYRNQPGSRRQLDANILVVDDVPDIRNLIGHIIAEAGCNVTYACDGDEAVAAYHRAQTSTPLDLIVMDLQMPTMTGVEATRIIRQDNRQIPIIALTAATMKGEKERCLQAGVTDYLSKPVDTERLLTMLINYLPSKTHQGQQKEKKRVLLVEDHLDVLQVTVSLIEHLGYEAYPAENGQQAIEQFRSLKPELTLIDINLPDMDGFSLASRLRTEGGRNISLVALSGDEISGQALSESEFDGSLLKPISLDALASTIKEYLGTANS